MVAMFFLDGVTDKFWGSCIFNVFYTEVLAKDYA